MSNVNQHWTPEEVTELMEFLTEDERTEMSCAVHFAEMARARPESQWGPMSSWGPEGPLPAKPDEKDMMTSAEMVDMLDSRLGELLRLAVIRKGFRN